MNHGVKLVSLAVQDVGAIAGRIDLGPFSAGVNVISGRNEAGKSTLVGALRAVLFERHDAKHQGIKALQTHGTRNAPEVWVELDIGGERVSVHKRFLERPIAEVRFAGDGATHHGAEADEVLLDRLEGRLANRRKSTRNDMGLWGLLWVTQDDSAHADPGEALDENVRGALSDAIGRQIGHVMGGKHGERVRTLVLDHAGHYFTRKTNAKTGDYRVAEERRAAADARVRQIEQAIAEVEEQASQHAASAERLRDAESKLPGLEGERTAAIAEQERVGELAGLSREAESRLTAAEAKLDVAQKDVEARAALARDVEALDGEIERIDETRAELDKTLSHLRRAANDARERAGRARLEVAAARSALEVQNERLERARRHGEARRVEVERRDAEKVAAELDEALDRFSTEAIDERAFEQIEGLASQVAALRARLDADGTRIVVYPEEGGSIVRSVDAVSTIEIPGLGVLEVEPAGAGLAQAVADAGKSRAKLEEALLALGVSDVQEARDRYAVRAEAELELAALSERKRLLAPRGLAAVEQDASTAQLDRARVEAALDAVMRAEREREDSARRLAETKLDEGAIEELRQKERGVAVLRAACDAIGTQVELVALTDLRIRTTNVDVAEGLSTGKSASLTLTQTATLVLEGIAEIRLEPRGEDLAKSRTKLERAERELAASFQAFGVTDMEGATQAVRVWARLDAARRGAEARVLEGAPEGLEKLRAAVDVAREQSRTAAESLPAARQVFARIAQLEVELAQGRVTKEALARLEKLERALRVDGAEMEKLTARVRAVSGPVVGGPQRAWAASAPLRPAPCASIVWEIIPGEVSVGLGIERIEQRLREALERAAVTDLDVAKARFREGLTLGAQIVQLRKQIQSLAPDGLDALRTRAAALAGDAVSVEAEGALDLAAHQAGFDALRGRLQVAEVCAAEADGDLERAERQLGAQESSLGEIVAVRREKSARLEVVTTKLAVMREVEPDAVLALRDASAQAAQGDARVAAQKAAADLDAATPQLLRGEVLRAEGAITSLKATIAALRDEALRLETLLERASVEGRFEELGDARAEQAEAVESLARIEREAGAAKLLANVMEEVYVESQRLFHAPVLKEAAPYLTRLRPGTELRMTPDLKLDKVVRRGAEEDFDQLSGGTREQLSVIVRLSLARVMARDKRPLPLILDDTMGWTDDGRFLSMVQILRDAAVELQIVLLTCHPSRFDRFQAEYSVDLDRLRAGRPRAPDLGSLSG